MLAEILYKEPTEHCEKEHKKFKEIFLPFFFVRMIVLRVMVYFHFLILLWWRLLIYWFLFG